LLALADSWDVMTVSRPYSVPKAPAAALRECEALSGRQFTASSVVALMALDRAGTLASLSGESESPATGSRPVAERRGGEPGAARRAPSHGGSVRHTRSRRTSSLTNAFRPPGVSQAMTRPRGGGAPPAPPPPPTLVAGEDGKGLV